MSQSTKTLLIVGFTGAVATVLLFGLGGALMPLLIAFVFAYLSFPAILWLERHRIQRVYAVAAVFMIIAAILVLIFVLVLPSFVNEGRLFLQELPQTAAVAADKVEAFAHALGYWLDLSRNGLKGLLVEYASSISGDFLSSSSSLLKGLVSNFVRGLLVVLNLLLIPLFFFHFVNKYEAISHEAHALMPIPWRPKAREYAKLVNTVLSGYVRGQILVALILAALYGIGFSIVGLKFGLLIGVCTGLLSIIPFVGSLLGLVAAMAVAIAGFTGLGSIISVILVFAIIQGLEGLVITPKLVGNKVGLGILSTMLALIIGGNLFGFIGMIAAIPIAAVLKAILYDLRREYQELKFYKG